MKRKIIKQGNNSYTLTLPIHWIREEGLKEGNDVFLKHEDRQIVIELAHDFKPPETSINIDIKSYAKRTILNILNQNYRKGYDRILLGYTNPSQIEAIKEIVHQTLLGFELVEIQKDVCIIQNIAEPSAEKFDVILRKIFFSIQQETTEILNDLTTKKFNTEKREETKQMIDNYTNFCRRVIIKNRIGGRKNSYALMNLVSKLSLIAHAHYYLHLYAEKQKKYTPKKEILELYKKSIELFAIFSSAFYKKEIDLADKVEFIRDNLFKTKIYPLLEKTTSIDSVIIYHIAESIRLTHVATTNLFFLLNYSGN